MPAYYLSLCELLSWQIRRLGSHPRYIHCSKSFQDPTEALTVGFVKWIFKYLNSILESSQGRLRMLLSDRIAGGTCLSTAGKQTLYWGDGSPSVVYCTLCLHTLPSKFMIFREGLNWNTLILLAAQLLISHRLRNHLSLSSPTHIRLQWPDQLDKNGFQTILWLLLRINFFLTPSNSCFIWDSLLLHSPGCLENHSVAQAGLCLTTFLLPQSPQYWDYRPEPP